MPDRDDLQKLSLLGKADTRLPASPDDAVPESFPNHRPGRRYWITLTCPEFSSLCPVTGQRDSAKVVFRYVPGTKCVETKSLKFYLASFRNQPAFNEEINPHFPALRPDPNGSFRCLPQKAKSWQLVLSGPAIFPSLARLARALIRHQTQNPGLEKKSPRSESARPEKWCVCVPPSFGSRDPATLRI